ncbi:sigma-54 dependent transcriptional regulator [Kiritimatiellaeota bacterium B1221]|nr:sigma-54 dependent transcriptional regulator [Kiritimatiellaeota bacterium B1221]
MAKILIVDDEPSVLSVLSNLLKGQGFDIQPSLGGEKAVEYLNAESFDLMLTDIRMDPVDGMELLKIAKSVHPTMSVMVVTAYGSVETAVQAMKEGAFDYVTKPFKVDELMITVQRALEYRRALHENQQLKAQLDFRYGLSDIVAESADMRKICTMIERVAPTDQTVLIGGESGVGKEVIAKAIHANSIRKQQNFVPINCAALPEPLLESELFGHVKGAFTGASSEKEGLFEVASGGTIFLDEIGSMSLNLQSKLLRVLQEKEIRRVGGTREIKVDPRVIAASNDDLEKLISEGKFREDLYYRLSVIPLVISPLRNRTEDIIPLAHFFMNMISEKAGVPMPELSPEVQIILESYNWPGNVRELENAIRHGCTFAQNGVLRSDDLPARVVTRSKLSTPNSPMPYSSSEEYRGRSLKGYLREMEKQFITDTINEFHGDKEAAAKSLKVSLATLYRKLPDAD